MAVSANDIQGLYIAYFNRPADYLGLQFWTDAANKAGGINAVANAFSASPEYTAAYAGKSTAAIIDQIYMNLFGRHAELDGIKFWGSALDNKVLGLGNIAYQIMKGAQDTDGGFADKTAVANKIAAATAFYNALDTSAEVIAYSGDAANAVAKAWLAGVTDQASLDAATSEAGLAAITGSIVTVGTPPVPSTTFDLTTNIDPASKFTGGTGNDVFNAPVIGGFDALSSLDSIDGAGGSDTLNVVTSGTSLAAGVTVKNIETANLSTSGAFAAANVSGWTGLTTLNVAAGGAIAGVVAAATTDINVASGLAGVAVNGGKDVTISNSTAGNINVGATTGAAGNIVATNTFSGGTVTVKGAGVETVTAKGGAMTFVNGTEIKATASGAVSLADRTAHTNAATAADSANTKAGANTDTSGKAKVAAATKVTTLATLATDLAAATNVNADATTALSVQLATTTAFRAGAISAAEKIAIDAAFAGSLATSTAAARTAAQAVLTPLQTAATAASTAANAADVSNDALALAAKSAADSVVADDTAAAALVEAATVTATTNTTLATVTITGNYGNTNNIGHNAVTDASTLHNVLTSVTLNNAAGATLTGDALTKVVVNDGQNSVSIVNNAVGHTQNLTLNNVVGGTITDNNATTLNIVTSGEDGSEASVSATSATAVKISGTGMIFDNQSFAAAAVIDATATTGEVDIAVVATQTYTGGSGVDVVTVSNGVAQSKTVSGGAGSADVLVLGNATDFGTAAAAAKFTNFEVLELNAGIGADVTAFTGSTFTKLVLDGSSVVTGLNATQAGNVQVKANATINLGVTGAATVGQLDTVNLLVSDGSGATSTVTLTTPVLAGVETLNITATDNVVISALTSATALTKVAVTGSGTVSITSGVTALNVNTVIDASADNSATVLNFGAATGNGVSLKAGNGNNTLTGTDIAAKGNAIISGNGNSTVTGGQADDSITVGNGNNTVHAAAGSNTIIVGNGDNTVDAVGSTTNTITAGNGWNQISGGSGVDVITVGTGGNLITGGAGGDKITFGTHVAGVIDGLKLVAAGDTLSAATTAALATAVATSANGADIVTGVHAGDTINVATVINTITGTLGTTIASAAGTTAALVTGTYDTTTKAFTVGASGADSMFVYDIDGAGTNTVVEAVVLVGYHGTATAAAGIVTLG